MYTTNAVHRYFSSDKTQRLELLISQVDSLAELAAGVSRADYVAIYFKSGGVYKAAAYCAAGECRVTNPESIEAGWTYDTENYFAGRVTGHEIMESDLSQIPDSFAAMNNFRFSCALPYSSSGQIESVFAFYWKDSPSVDVASLGKSVAAIGKASSGLMHAIDEIRRLHDYSLRLSRLIDLLDLPIADYRFKDFVAELIKKSHIILDVEGICLFKQDMRTSKLQLQEVVARQKPEPEFLTSISKTLGDSVAADDEQSIGFHAVRDLSPRLPGTTKKIAAVGIVPEKFFRYEVVVWVDGQYGLSKNDREILSVFAVLCNAMIRNAILLRHAKKARRILERNSSLMADMETTAALADMTSGVAHEFNNIIGGVIGRLQLIKMKNDDSNLLEQLELIEKMILEGARTVKSIQEYTVGAEYKNLSPVDLSQVVRDAMAGSENPWQVLADSRSIKIKADIQISDAVIYGNSEDLLTVIDKVMQNAVEHSPDNSTVCVSLQRHNDRLRLSVADSGSGIPTINKAKVFYPFFSSKQDRMAGLGLSVAHGIVSRHKGKISIKDNKPQGAVFEIELTEIDAKADYSEITNRHVRDQRLQILIVDDDLQIREILRDMLSMKGHIPTTCADGYAALEALEKQDFDLIITDLGMPGISGMDLARQAHEAKPGMPIAMITGWGSQLNKSDVVATGIKAILSKPFHLKEIQALIEELV